MIYNDDFYAALQTSAGSAASVILPLVWARYNPRSVIDVGCGGGSWLVEGKRLGATRVLGVDGPWMPAKRRLIHLDEFIEHDLSKPIPGVVFAPGFDLAICLEVAEHLPGHRSDGLVAELAQSPIVLFSAATPGQGGDGHVNEQPHTYWTSRFTSRGYTERQWIRAAIGDTTIAWWYKNNITLYVRQ